MLTEGDKAPRLTSTSYDGGAYDIGTPGKPTVLFFYVTADTPG
jgi:peroxiredoxin